jgi:ribose 1,5-bisphosphokinase PhnN
LVIPGIAQSLGSGSGAGSARGLHHAVGLDALGAHPQTGDLAVDQRAYGLEIGIPAAIALVVGVADVVTEAGSLATNVADTSHESEPDELRIRIIVGVQDLEL